MMTIYRPPRSRASSRSRASWPNSDVSDEDEVVIPPGTTYLTKINGKLVMARDKHPKAVARDSVAMDLLGEAFGVRPRVMRRRSSSFGRAPTPLMIGGVPYVPAIPQPPYTVPLLQQPFTPGPGMQPLPHYPPAPHMPNGPNYPQYPNPPMPLEPRKFSVGPPREPTEAEIEELKRIDADYHARHDRLHKHRRITSGSTMDEASVVSKTTITVTKHVCAQCGRIRSKKYHQEHPIKDGEKPVPAFCRKCQRDSSSTDGSVPPKRDPPKVTKEQDQKQKQKSKHKKPDKDASELETKSPAPGKKKGQPKKDPKKAKPVAIFTTDEEEEVECEPRPKPQRVQTNKGKETVHTTYPEYVVVEEYSEVDSVEVPRGRLRIRHDEHYDDRRPLSPRANQSYVRASPDIEQHRYPDGSELKHGSISKGGYRRMHERSPSPGASYGSARPSPQRHEEYEERNAGYERRRAAEETVYTSTENPRSSRRAQNLEPPRSMSSREESFESFSSNRLDENRPRRRRERRAHPPVPSNTPATQAWGPPHIIHPQPGDSKVVVTETYVYRPRRERNDSRRTADGQREPRRFVDHSNDRVKYDTRRRDDSPDPNYAYYQNDWHGEEPLREKPRISRGYRRGKVQDSELYSDITDSVQYREAYDAVHQNLPRAPTPPPILSLSPDRGNTYIKTHQPRPYPPSSISSEAEPQRRRHTKTHHDPPYPASPTSSDSELPHSRGQKSRKGKEKARSPPTSFPQRRARSRAPSAESNHRPPFVREATDGGTERALIPSPMRTRERDPFADEFSADLSDEELSAMGRRERDAERGAEREKEGKRVAFMGVGVDEGSVVEVPVKKWDYY